MGRPTARRDLQHAVWWAIVSYSLDIPADLIASLRDSARDATISAARTFGFGGSTWDYAEPTTGATATGPKTLTAMGTVQALAFRQKPGVAGPAAGTTPILQDVWRLIILEGTVRPGGVIVSQDDDRYRFSIGTIEPWYEYRRSELERLRGAITITSATVNARVTVGGDRRITIGGNVRVVT